MKFSSAVAALAHIAFASATADPRFPSTGPFKMIVLAYDSPAIHYSYVQALDGRLTIGTETNSSCGDVPPTFNGGTGSVSLYNADANAAQQVFIDISGAAGGLASYIGPLWQSIPTSAVANEFERVQGDTISTLTVENKTWIACTSTDAAGYYVFAAADYSRDTREGCLDFEIRTDKVDSPQSCTYY